MGLVNTCDQEQRLSPLSKQVSEMIQFFQLPWPLNYDADVGEFKRLVPASSLRCSPAICALASYANPLSNRLHST